jgi:hypothetical protein
MEKILIAVCVFMAVVAISAISGLIVDELATRKRVWPTDNELSKKCHDLHGNVKLDRDFQFDGCLIPGRKK